MTRRFLDLATVERFNNARCGGRLERQLGSDFSVLAYDLLCSHLKQRKRKCARFLTADEGYYSWLVDCHRQVQKAHDDLIPRYRTPYNL